MKRDIDVVVHTYMERLGDSTKTVEDEVVVSVTQQIFQDNDSLSSVDALVEQLIQKKNGAKIVDIDAAGQSTPISMQAKPDITNTPSGLKECCSINLEPLRC